MKEEQTTFKVTDRRLFNADGTPRDVPEEEKVKPVADASEIRIEPEAAPAPASAADAGPRATSEAADNISQVGEEDFDESGVPDAGDPAGFINFAMTIATNAASALGMIEHPVTHSRDVDLELGKHWIDVLGMLQKKTRGNLTPQEAQILEGWLADLRMQYVSLQHATPPKASQAYTGHDITGGK